MEHHILYKKYKKGEGKMKKILNFRKFIGPFFGLFVFVFICVTAESEDPTIMTLWLVLPVLSYGFTMLYHSKEGPGWLKTIMTLSLMALAVTLSIASVNSCYLQIEPLSYIIARLLCANITIVGMVYGLEQILTNQEDNFFEVIQ